MTDLNDSLPSAIQRMLDASNVEDRDGFISTFTGDAVVDDFGRTFTGRDEITGWSDREHIGTHNRIAVTRWTPTAAGAELDITVTGDGYNGTGTFACELQDDLIRRLVIRG